MPETTVEMPPQEAAAIVRKFYDSLAGGRMVDALDLVATDAILQDEKGGESRGIRAIAASLLPFRKPDGISLEAIESTTPDVRVVFRMDKSRRLRGHFSVDHGRIRSVRFERT
ncbi:MAG TPA: hypothetical protein VJN63_12430 [Thermoplasmata archaeon]|nr:hypothetical protein [Thermoplasmata archaeon]